MHITSVTLKHFRCFEKSTFDFPSKVTVIEGDNGSGKTSLLEALHYACYLKSFRTRSSRELIAFDHDHFFINVSFDDEHDLAKNQIQIGFSSHDKVVKRNGKSISSYKDIISHYRVISSTEDDLALVRGAPDERRSFLNHSLLLEDPAFIGIMRLYRQTLLQRNHLLERCDGRLGSNDEELNVWTKQLWEQSCLIQRRRTVYLSELEMEMNELMRTFFYDAMQQGRIMCTYHAKHSKAHEKNFAAFWRHYCQSFKAGELRLRRSLFGAHLDDFSIEFHQKKAKTFASRGQQKLIVFLLKLAQLRLLHGAGKPVCLALDDFLTDFDGGVLEKCLASLEQMPCQIFVTCPLKSFIFPEKQSKFDVQVISL